MTLERSTMIINEPILQDRHIPPEPPADFQCGKTTLDPVHKRNTVINVAKKDILLRNVQWLVGRPD